MTKTSSHRLTDAGELCVAFCCLWFTGGVFLDGWAHNHVPELETFFTPWHGAFYSGFAVTALLLLFFAVRNRRDGTSLLQAAPHGYAPALLGCAVFLAGGVGDLIWHQVFGVEADIEALLSPTHLILAVGMTLMLSGGFLSWWRRPAASQPRTLWGQLPLLASVTCMLSLFTFMTQYSHFVDLAPVEARPEDPFFNQALAVTGYLLHTILLCGMLFTVMRRGKPAFGFLTLLLTVNVGAMAVMRYGLPIIPAAFIAALTADAVLRLVEPMKHPTGVRVFAFWLPFNVFLLYMATLLLRGGMWWSIHMWTGAAVLAGFAGLLTSFLVWPPETADERRLQTRRT
jgi:hypothetical protein